MLMCLIIVVIFFFSWLNMLFRELMFDLIFIWKFVIFVVLCCCWSKGFLIRVNLLVRGVLFFFMLMFLMGVRG